MRRLWLTTERLSHSFFPPFLILIKVLVQDKQCLPTLQFKQRGPLRPKRWFLNVHWQVGLICVLSRWRWTYIYLFYLAYIHSPAISLPLWNFMVLLCLKCILVLHKFCSLVYICYAVLKVRTGPAVETWTKLGLDVKTAASPYQGLADHDWGPRWRFTLPLHWLSLGHYSPCPGRLVQYSCGHWKPCYCVVSCQQLRDFTIAARLRSTKFKWLNC